MVKQQNAELETILRRHYPFQSHFMDIHGHRLHYADEGTGPPIVMIHGNPTWSFYYRHLIKVFSKTYRTIAPDHIGCGFSDKPTVSAYPYTLSQRVEDLNMFLSALDLKDRITLVLHDWGGMIGMAYAVQYPERIHRIVLLNTAAFLPPKGKRLPLRLWMVRNLTLLSKPAVLGLNLFARSALFMATRKPLSMEVKQCLIAPYNSWQNRTATYRFVKDIPLRPSDPSYKTVADVSEKLHLLKDIPFLICWGRHDFVFDLDYLEEWRQRFPKADTHLFDEAGHYVLEDAPERIESLMTDFLSKTDGSY